MMKKDYESPKAEFFRVEESVFCSGFGYETEDSEENPYG